MTDSTLLPYLREASGLPPGAGALATLDAAARAIGTNRTTIYRWISHGDCVPLSPFLVRLAGAVDASRERRGAPLISMADLLVMAGLE